MTNLAKALKGQTYYISKVNSEDGDLVLRLSHLGFNAGEAIKLIRRAPLFRDPLLFQVGNSQIILTRKEAESIEVEEKVNSNE